MWEQEPEPDRPCKCTGEPSRSPLAGVQVWGLRTNVEY